MIAAFKALQPETCTIYIEEIDYGGNPPSYPTLYQLGSMVDQLNFKTRINVHYHMPLMHFLEQGVSICVHALGLADVMRYHSWQNNGHVLLHIDIDLDD